jgi:hypothetical protein
MAVLLTEDKRIVSGQLVVQCRPLTRRVRKIEFPSILLPPDISSGSIVDITVSRNHSSENTAQKAFAGIQTTIYQTFGLHSPSPPVLRCRNATQTSVVLEWDPVELATAELRSLSLYRNGSKAGSIPRPTEITSTKISGLAVDTEYTFHLVLRTSAGTYSSEKLAVRTHKMTELSGITVTPGVMPAALKESLTSTIDRIGARLIDTVRIDTTHFVCTEGRGQAWEKAVEMNIPVVVPDWIKGCEREGRIVGVRGYYLNADPRLRQVGPSVNQQQQAQSPPEPQSPPRQSTPRTEITPPTPERASSSRHPFGSANGAHSDDEEPPTPPPKSRPSTAISQGTTLADPESLADTAKGKEFASGDEESEEEKTEEESQEPSASTKDSTTLPIHTATVEDEKDVDGSFSDVAL